MRAAVIAFALLVAGLQGVKGSNHEFHEAHRRHFILKRATTPKTQSVNSTTPPIPPTVKSSAATQATSTNAGFVTTKSGALYIGSKKWNFRGFNSPHLLGSSSNQPFEIEDTFRSIAIGFARPVTRTYTLQIGPGQYVSASDAHVTGYNATAQDWIYNEAKWVLTDNVLATAQRYGVKVILPIINQDFGSSSNNWAGNYIDLIQQYYNISSYSDAQQQVDFFQNATMRVAYKQLLYKLLTRKNTVNGRIYGQDDTFLAFETGNELQWTQGNGDTLGAPANWTIDIAAYIKKYAPKTLVIDGSFSRSIGQGFATMWRPEVFTSPYVDALSYHFYGDGDGRQIKTVNDYVRSKNKTFIPTESGFYSTTTSLQSIMNNDNSAGNLLWSMRPHSTQGGYVVHSEGDGIFSYHIPGWSTVKDAKNFDGREQGYVDIARNGSYKLVSATVPSYPVPVSPQPFGVNINGTQYLSFRGSSWAKTYTIYEIKTGSNASWTTAVSNFTDNVGPGNLTFKIPFVKASAPKNGWNATGAWYAIVGFSVTGTAGPLSQSVYVPFKA